MLPLRDNTPRRSWPWMTLLIIGFTGYCFYLQLGKNSTGLAKMLANYALVPAKFKNITLARFEWELLLPLFSFNFLHGGWLHFIGNMWTLWLFGDNVEDRLGHFRFLGFYLLSGVLSGLVHLMTNLNSPIPTLGASGAIAGVMGAYFIFFPGARILTLVPIFFFIQLVEIPAVIFLGLWFLLQFVSGVGALADSRAAGGIAWWAHIGGFIAGLVLGRILRRR